MTELTPKRRAELRELAKNFERDGEVAKLEAKFAADAAAHDSAEEDAENFSRE